MEKWTLKNVTSSQWRLPNFKDIFQCLFDPFILLLVMRATRNYSRLSETDNEGTIGNVHTLSSIHSSVPTSNPCNQNLKPTRKTKKKPTQNNPTYLSQHRCVHKQTDLKQHILNMTRIFNDINNM